MPAPKKHPSTRARANRATTAATLPADSGSATAVIVRNLPDERDWHPLTVEWWNALWTSPMASEYHTSDWYQLVLLAIAYDRLLDPDLSPAQFKVLSEEVRSHRTPFGMTPYDRRRLEWQIESSEDAKDRGKQRRARNGVTQPARDNDPRQVFRIVS